jgi:hypothetical protein
MRRLARHLSTLCWAVSLLLCAVTVVFWFSSYRTTRQIGVVRPPHRAYLSSSDGVVRLSLGNSTGETWPAEYVEPAGWVVEAWPTPDRTNGSLWQELPPGLRGRMGFHARRDRLATLTTAFGTVLHRTGNHAYVPHWFLVGVLALLPAAAVRRAARRRRRSALGHCRPCGYDLRATPGRCPECGAAAPDPLTTPAA